MKRNASLFIILFLIALGVVLGLYQLFDLRFRSGDMFPAYSSFRSDPKGTKILYRSMEEYTGLDTRRLIKPLESLEPGGETVLFLGSSFQSLSHQLDDVLEPYLEDGGRALVAFQPEKPRHKRRNYEHHHSVVDEEDKDEGEEGASEPEETVEEHEEEECYLCHREKILNQWQLQCQQFTHDELDEMAVTELAVSTADEQQTIPWTSALYFEELEEEWTVRYEFSGKPVVIEREWESGHLVLMADSYLFSNEAMVKDRNLQAIAELIGAPTSIIFDELHLGIQSSESIMMLVNRYRLTGVLYALLVVCILYIWKQSSSLVPKLQDGNEAENLGAHVDAGQGFVNLLKRHVPQKELLSTLVKEWKSTFEKDKTRNRQFLLLTKEFNRLQADEKKVHPIDGYNRLLKMMNERK